MDQIEIESWCVNQRTEPFGETTFARATVANDERAELQEFDHWSWVVAYNFVGNYYAIVRGSERRAPM
jgi:hypothetical protein